MGTAVGRSPAGAVGAAPGSAAEPAAGLAADEAGPEAPCAGDDTVPDACRDSPVAAFGGFGPEEHPAIGSATTRSRVDSATGDRRLRYVT
ncbi:MULTISPECIES: hypothetical protein [unclassified Kitasatospora]|uniref:hypothetical protein n=1 Tax=unclassified Kitasatospora TaxID=2633591 RepID=UPI0038082E7F